MSSEYINRILYNPYQASLLPAASQQGPLFYQTYKTDQLWDDTFKTPEDQADHLIRYLTPQFLDAAQEKIVNQEPFTDEMLAQIPDLALANVVAANMEPVNLPDFDKLSDSPLYQNISEKLKGIGIDLTSRQTAEVVIRQYISDMLELEHEGRKHSTVGRFIGHTVGGVSSFFANNPSRAIAVTIGSIATGALAVSTAGALGTALALGRVGSALLRFTGLNAGAAFGGALTEKVFLDLYRNGRRADLGLDPIDSAEYFKQDFKMGFALGVGFSAGIPVIKGISKKTNEALKGFASNVRDRVKSKTGKDLTTVDKKNDGHSLDGATLQTVSEAVEADPSILDKTPEQRAAEFADNNIHRNKNTGNATDQELREEIRRSTAHPQTSPEQTDSYDPHISDIGGWRLILGGEGRKSTRAVWNTLPTLLEGTHLVKMKDNYKGMLWNHMKDMTDRELATFAEVVRVVRDAKPKDGSRPFMKALIKCKGRDAFLNEIKKIVIDKNGNIKLYNQGEKNHTILDAVLDQQSVEATNAARILNQLREEGGQAIEKPITNWGEFVQEQIGYYLREYGVEVPESATTAELIHENRLQALSKNNKFLKDVLDPRASFEQRELKLRDALLWESGRSMVESAFGKDMPFTYFNYATGVIRHLSFFTAKREELRSIYNQAMRSIKKMQSSEIIDDFLKNGEIAEVSAELKEKLRHVMGKHGVEYGEIENHIPQKWDPAPMVAKGFDKWFDFMFPLLDKQKTHRVYNSGVYDDIASSVTTLLEEIRTKVAVSDEVRAYKKQLTDKLYNEAIAGKTLSEAEQEAILNTVENKVFGRPLGEATSQAEIELHEIVNKEIQQLEGKTVKELREEWEKHNKIDDKKVEDRDFEMLKWDASPEERAEYNSRARQLYDKANPGAKQRRHDFFNELGRVKKAVTLETHRIADKLKEEGHTLTSQNYKRIAREVRAYLTGDLKKLARVSKDSHSITKATREETGKINKSSNLLDLQKVLDMSDDSYTRHMRDLNYRKAVKARQQQEIDSVSEGARAVERLILAKGAQPTKVQLNLIDEAVKSKVLDWEFLDVKEGVQFLEDFIDIKEGAQFLEDLRSAIGVKGKNSVTWGDVRKTLSKKEADKGATPKTDTMASKLLEVLKKHLPGGASQEKFIKTLTELELLEKRVDTPFGREQMAVIFNNITREDIIEPSATEGLRPSMNKKSRVLYFYDVDHFTAANEQFGATRDIRRLVAQDMEGAIRQIALTETLDGTPEFFMAKFRAITELLQGNKPLSFLNAQVLKLVNSNIEYMRGNFQKPLGVFGAVGNLAVSLVRGSALGGAGLTAIFEDAQTAAFMGSQNGTGFQRSLGNYVKAITKRDISPPEAARVLNIIENAEMHLHQEAFSEMTSRVAERLNSIASKVDEFNFKYNGLNYITEHGNFAVSQMFFDELANLPNRPRFKKMLRGYGLDDGDFKRLGRLNKADDGLLVFPEAFKDTTTYRKVLTAFYTERRLAIAATSQSLRAVLTTSGSGSGIALGVINAIFFLKRIPTQVFVDHTLLPLIRGEHGRVAKFVLQNYLVTGIRMTLKYLAMGYKPRYDDPNFYREVLFQSSFMPPVVNHILEQLLTDGTFNMHDNYTTIGKLGFGAYAPYAALAADLADLSRGRKNAGQVARNVAMGFTPQKNNPALSFLLNRYVFDSMLFAFDPDAAKKWVQMERNRYQKGYSRIGGYS